MKGIQGRATNELACTHLEVCFISGKALGDSGRHGRLWRKGGLQSAMPVPEGLQDPNRRLLLVCCQGAPGCARLRLSYLLAEQLLDSPVKERWLLRQDHLHMCTHWVRHRAGHAMVGVESQQVYPSRPSPSTTLSAQMPKTTQCKRKGLQKSYLYPSWHETLFCQVGSQGRQSMWWHTAPLGQQAQSMSQQEVSLQILTRGIAIGAICSVRCTASTSSSSQNFPCCTRCIRLCMVCLGAAGIQQYPPKVRDG